MTRRRVAVVVGLASLAFVALSTLALAKLSASIPIRTTALVADSVLTIMLAFMFSVVLAVGAAFLAAPTIASEVESGISLAILPRPLSRAEYVLGKWLGLAALLTAYGAVLGSVEIIAIALVTGYRPPHPATALAYLIVESLAMLSLALLFSTRLPATAGGLLSVLCFGLAWIAGIAGNVADSLHNAAIMHAATLVGLLIPTDGFWRGTVYHLEPVMMLVASASNPTAGQNPFSANAPPPPAFLAWTAGWLVAVIGAAVASFTWRDV